MVSVWQLIALRQLRLLKNVQEFLGYKLILREE